MTSDGLRVLKIPETILVGGYLYNLVVVRIQPWRVRNGFSTEQGRSDHIIT